MPLTQVNDIATSLSRSRGREGSCVILEWERKATVSPVVVAPVTTITLVAVVVTLQETLAIGLLVLTRVTVSSIPAIRPIVTVAVAIVVRTLRIVVLATLCISRAGI